MNFPVEFPVSREFGPENGSLETPSTAIAWSSSSRDARTGLVANPESGFVFVSVHRHCMEQPLA